MLKSLFVVASCVCSSMSWAQASGITKNDLSLGINLPATSAALTEDATSVVVNPASLILTGPLQSYYVHEQTVANKGNNALFLGLAPFKGFGLGLSTEWLRDNSGNPYRKSAIGFAIGDKALSVGAALSSFASNSLGDLNGLNSLDLGLASRPARYASFAFLVRNIESPSRGNTTLPIQYGLGVGIRPFGENVTLATDYIIDKNRPILEGRLNYTLHLRFLRGITILGGMSHGITSVDPTSFQLGVRLDGTHLGATYASGFAQSQNNQTLAIRLSSEKFESALPQPKTMAMFDLDSILGYAPSTAALLLGEKPVDPFLTLARLFEEAAEDTSLGAVVIKSNGLDIGMAKAQEIRAGIRKLQLKGKKVIVVLLSASDGEYLAYAGADRIVAVPAAVLQLDGLAASTTFLGDAMNKLGVRWEVARVGAYKNAPDQLTLSSMSREQKESVNAYLDTNFNEYINTVSASRKLKAENFQACLNEGLKSPTRAMELGLIDDIVDPQELDRKLLQWAPDTHLDLNYQPREVREERWGQRKQIAIVPVIGNITGGPSRDGTFGVSTNAGAETVVKAIKEAESNPNVAAIVLRIDSGGGDTLASDLMYRAVLEAKKKKPVIASMGDVAASGGYYVAMGADSVFAQPTTLTGSIGVFFVKPAIADLATKLGVKNETIRRGDLSGMMGLFDPWSPAERAAAQKWVDSFYDSFISEVARNRRMTKAEVDQVAQGRVWSGDDAKKRNLVDELGGFQEAIAEARKRARISQNEDIELVVVTDPSRGLTDISTSVSQAFTPKELPYMRLVRDLGLDSNFSWEPGLRAQMEFTISVR